MCDLVRRTSTLAPWFGLTDSRVAGAIPSVATSAESDESWSALARDVFDILKDDVAEDGRAAALLASSALFVVLLLPKTHRSAIVCALLASAAVVQAGIAEGGGRLFDVPLSITADRCRRVVSVLAGATRSRVLICLSRFLVHDVRSRELVVFWTCSCVVWCALLRKTWRRQVVSCLTGVLCATTVLPEDHRRTATWATRLLTYVIAWRLVHDLIS